MHKFKIGTRVFISIVFLLLGLAFLLHTYFDSYRKQIDTLMKERDGVAFLRAATQANEAFTHYRILLYHARAGTTLPHGLELAKENADAAYERLGAAYGVYGARLGLGEEYLARRKRSHIAFPAVERLWRRVAVLPPDAVGNELLSDVYVTFIALSDHVSETSNMANDDDLPSYSLMDASVNHITHAMNRLFGFSGEGYSALITGEELPLESRLWAWDMSAYITDYNMVKVGANIENTLYYDRPDAAEMPYLRETQAAYAVYAQAGQEMSEVFSRAARGLEVDMETYDRQLQAYRTAMYDLWYTIADQLELRLTQRAEAAREKLYHALLVALVCSLFALGFFAYIMRDITRSFKVLEDATDRIVQGELDAGVPYQERGDEIGHMARCIERLRQSYWWLRDE